MRDRRTSTDVTFIVGAAVILIGIIFVSVAFGIAPAVDPAFVAP